MFAELRDRAKGSAAKFFGKIGSESVAVPGFKTYRSSTVEEKFSLGQAPFIRSVQQTLSLQQCASLCAQSVSSSSRRHKPLPASERVLHEYPATVHDCAQPERKPLHCRMCPEGNPTVSTPSTPL